jgi:hypothetical protein
MNNSKFNATSSTKHGELFQSKPVSHHHANIQEMMESAVPIWEILRITEEAYMEKYVKPFLHKSSEVIVNVVEEVENVVLAVEEILPSSKPLGDLIIGVCESIEEMVECCATVAVVLENGDSDNDSDCESIPSLSSAE